MRLSPYTFEVSEDFVRWALELAFKKVYEHRRERYKDSSELVRNAIEFRYDRSDDFIENFLEIGSGNIDPYDEVDSRFASDEKTYKEIYEEEVYPNLDEEDQKEYWEFYEGKTDQDHLIYEWCDENDYWYDDYYQIAIQNCFNYWY
jgi:hypothetical protein